MEREVVLVVRETASLADSVEELLSSEGYQVESVPNAREGQKLLASSRGRRVRATVVVCNEAVCSGLSTLATTEWHPPLIVLGWRGRRFALHGPGKLVLLSLPISVDSLLGTLRSASEGRFPDPSSSAA